MALNRPQAVPQERTFDGRAGCISLLSPIVAPTSRLLGSPVVQVVLSVAAVTGVLVGLRSWHRTRLRFEAGMPVFHTSWPIWILCVILAMAPVYIAIVLFAVLPVTLHEALQEAFRQWASPAVLMLFTYWEAAWVARVVAIARYQSSRKTRLIAEWFGYNSIDLRELRILLQPPVPSRSRSRQSRMIESVRD